MRNDPASLPAGMWVLAALYFVASLAHFAHNAEFIAFYPHMPNWLSRETVYLAWLAVTSFGVAGLLAARFGFHALAALLVGAYGALGLDGLAHYTLALCSEHTFAANLTIWAEALGGLVLLLASAVWLVRRSSMSRRFEIRRPSLRPPSDSQRGEAPPKMGPRDS